MLLPPIARRIGTPLTAAGALVLFLRHGLLIAPEWLNWPVFAISSLFIQRRSFAMINNNVMDELGVILLVAGTLCIMFARERVESDHVRTCRTAALLTATWSQAGALLVVMLFTFGVDFFAGLLVSLAVFPLVFWVTFRLRLRRVPSAVTPPGSSSPPQPRSIAE